MAIPVLPLALAAGALYLVLRKPRAGALPPTPSAPAPNYVPSYVPPASPAAPPEAPAAPAYPADYIPPANYTPPPPTNPTQDWGPGDYDPFAPLPEFEMSGYRYRGPGQRY